MEHVTRLRRGDEVLVLSGAEQGKRGHLMRVDLEKKRALVQGVNFVKKHQRQRNQNVQAGIIEMEAPLRLCKLALICPKCNQPTRVGITREDGKRQRVCRKCGAVFA